MQSLLSPENERPRGLRLNGCSAEGYVSARAAVMSGMFQVVLTLQFISEGVPFADNVRVQAGSATTLRRQNGGWERMGSLVSQARLV